MVIIQSVVDYINNSQHPLHAKIYPPPYDNVVQIYIADDNNVSEVTLYFFDDHLTVQTDKGPPRMYAAKYKISYSNPEMYDKIVELCQKSE